MNYPYVIHVHDVATFSLYGVQDKDVSIVFKHKNLLSYFLQC